MTTTTTIALDVPALEALLEKAASLTANPYAAGGDAPFHSSGSASCDAMIHAVAADAYLNGVLHAVQTLTGTDNWNEMFSILRFPFIAVRGDR